MKILLIALACMLLPVQALLARDLAAQQAQAQQVAADNGAARPAEIASQLAEAFGAQKNSEALLAKAVQLTDANPSEAAAIAAAAAVFDPSSAPRIASTIAALPSLQSVGGGYKSTVEDSDPAARVAAAVAAAVPASAAAIAAAVAAIAPASTSAIQSAVSQAAPSQASAIAAALAPGAGTPPASVGLPSFNQFNSVNPANFSGGQATPTPTPPQPNSPSN